MRLLGAVACSEAGQTAGGRLDLKGVFTEITQDPVPVSLRCDLVIGLARDSDETPGEQRRLRVDMIHRETNSYIQVGEGPAVVPEFSAVITLKQGSLRLNGPGTYDIRMVDITNPSGEVPLASQPIFVVRAKADLEVAVA